MTLTSLLKAKVSPSKSVLPRRAALVEDAKKFHAAVTDDDGAEKKLNCGGSLGR